MSETKPFLDEKTMTKVIKHMLGAVKIDFLRSYYSYVIDSKFRITKRLDKFLSEQIENPDNSVLELAETLRNKDRDKTILNILKWVVQNIKYKYDIDNFGKAEYWATAKELLIRKTGDCDDANSLIYILARLAGIPSEFIYCVIGDTAGAGHYWVIYYSSKHNKLTAIDATYKPNLVDIKSRKVFFLDENNYQKIWYFFSDFYIFRPRGG